MIKINIKDGKVSAKVAINEPKTPPVFNPAKVATFIPTAPGVSAATAIICLKSARLYQP